MIGGLIIAASTSASVPRGQPANGPSTVLRIYPSSLHLTLEALNHAKNGATLTLTAASQEEVKWSAIVDPADLLTIDQAEGVLKIGESATIHLEVKDRNLPPGEHAAKVEIRWSARPVPMVMVPRWGEQRSTVVPVTLRVHEKLVRPGLGPGPGPVSGLPPVREPVPEPGPGSHLDNHAISWKVIILVILGIGAVLLVGRSMIGSNPPPNPVAEMKVHLSVPKTIPQVRSRGSLLSYFLEMHLTLGHPVIHLAPSAGLVRKISEKK